MQTFCKVAKRLHEKTFKGVEKVVIQNHQRNYINEEAKFDFNITIKPHLGKDSVPPMTIEILGINS